MVNLEKAITVLKALQMGKEIELDRYTYVWLDNYPTKVVGGVQYGIDGLALKGKSMTLGGTEDGKEKVHYIGSEMSVTHFVNLCNELSSEYILELITDVAFNEHRQKSTKRRGNVE